MTHNRLHPSPLHSASICLHPRHCVHAQQPTIGLLADLIQNKTAAKAGIYVFFSHQAKTLVRNSLLKRLVEMSKNPIFSSDSYLPHETDTNQTAYRS